MDLCSRQHTEGARPVACIKGEVAQTGDVSRNGKFSSTLGNS